MIIARTVGELLEAKKWLTGSIGFVPTMGALHHGHLSLIRQAKDENDHLIVSVFVNPTQFLEGEDLESYPRKDAADIKICELAGVDVLFMPTIDQMYEVDELRIGAPAVRGYILEGQKRPGHFDGMLQVVMKLLNLSSATKAYFGKKDAQQLNLIGLTVRQFFMNVEIVPVDIVRDSDGLALSSRNIYLSNEERKEALKIPKSLYVASQLIGKNIVHTQKIKKAMLEVRNKINWRTEESLFLDMMKEILV